MIVRRRRLASLLLVPALALAAGCSGGDDDQAPAASGQELKIGLLAPLKGPNAGAGVDAQRGAQLAVDVINGLNPSIPLPLASESGLPNLGGAQVRLVVEDANPPSPGSEQVTAGTAVNRLVSGEGVNALIGAYDAQVTEYASQRSERYEVPFVNADSPATFLTDAGRDWFFRIGPSWRSAGESFFALLQQNKVKPGKMIIVNAQDKAGQDVVTTVNDLSQESGFGKVVNVPFPPNKPNLQAEVDRVIAMKPDTLFLYATPANVIPLTQAFGVRNYKPKTAISFALGYLAAENFSQNASAVDGMLRSISWSVESANRNEAGRAVSSLYSRRFNSPMSEAAANAFTAVMTVAQAANNAGSVENQRLRSALLSLDVPGEDTIMPWAGVRFDETHQNVLAQSIVEQYMGKDLKFTIVYPRDSASGKLVWPAPGSDGATSAG